MPVKERIKASVAVPPPEPPGETLRIGLVIDFLKLRMGWFLYSKHFS